jgi:hypothetical protein
MILDIEERVDNLSDAVFGGIFLLLQERKEKKKGEKEYSVLLGPFYIGTRQVPCQERGLYHKFELI